MVVVALDEWAAHVQAVVNVGQIKRRCVTVTDSDLGAAPVSDVRQPDGQAGHSDQGNRREHNRRAIFPTDPQRRHNKHVA
jgi:hypothetical protein